MPGNLIDAHCHLADPRLAPFIDRVIEECGKVGITGFIQGGVDPDDWDRQTLLAERFPGRIHPCFGLHPWFVAAHFRDPAPVDRARGRLPGDLKRACALGELGLDYGPRFGPETHPYQKEIFAAQLGMLRDHPLPIVLHVVRAHGDALAILKAHGPPPRGGLVHLFSGGIEVAREYLGLGLTLSLGGSVARAKGHETLKRTVAALPEDGFVLETDCPDQLPDGYSPEWPGMPGLGGLAGLNDPRGLFRVAEVLAGLRKGRESPERLLEGSRERLVRIFGLSQGV